jgi:hypothetical protein
VVLIEVQMHNCGGLGNGGRVGKERGFSLVYVNSLCFSGLQFSILGGLVTITTLCFCYYPGFTATIFLSVEFVVSTFYGHLLFSSTTCFVELNAALEVARAFNYPPPIHMSYM